VSQRKIKHKPKIEIQNLGDEPRISSIKLAAMLGISVDEMNRIILKNADELARLGPVLYKDKDGTITAFSGTGKP
jgi:hypothetical protein